MKRAITSAILASLLLGLFGGYASAQTAEPEVVVSEEADTVSDEVNIHRILHFCRKMFGENDFLPERKEKCIELWKRWCNANPDSRICPDRPTRPCRDIAVDRLTDVRCPKPKPEPHPCRVLDEPSDRRCPLPKPCLDRATDLTIDCPHPCRVADAVGDYVCPIPLPIPIPHPCPPLDHLHARVDSARLSIAIDRLCYPPVDPVPVDRLDDRPKDRVIDRPTDREVDRTTDRVSDLPVLDATEVKERVGNDAHFGAATADH